MHEALVFMCTRVLVAASEEKPMQARFMSRVLEEPRLLPWYTEELLRNLNNEVVSAVRVGIA